MLLLLVLLTFSNSVASSSATLSGNNNNKNNNNDDIARIYLALDNGLNYILGNYRRFGVDGLFGVVLTKANLESLLQDRKFTKHDYVRIAELIDKTRTISTLINDKLAKSREPYNKLLDKILVSKVWQRRLHIKHNGLSPTSSYDNRRNVSTLNLYMNYLRGGNISEQLSDACISELLFDHRCRISFKCKDYMVDSDYYDPTYGITHRLLYLQIAKTQRCIMNERWFDNKTSSYCGYIHWEMKQNAFFGYIEELDDILLEQIILCGYEGYREFLARNLIEHVLDVQQASGCFKIPMLPPVVTAARTRRSANLFDDGCNDHTTGLGAAVLALYLRYYLLIANY